MNHINFTISKKEFKTIQVIGCQEGDMPFKTINIHYVKNHLGKYITFRCNKDKNIPCNFCLLSIKLYHSALSINGWMNFRSTSKNITLIKIIEDLEYPDNNGKITSFSFSKQIIDFLMKNNFFEDVFFNNKQFVMKYDLLNNVITITKDTFKLLNETCEIDESELDDIHEDDYIETFKYITKEQEQIYLDYFFSKNNKLHNILLKEKLLAIDKL